VQAETELRHSALFGLYSGRGKQQLDSFQAVTVITFTLPGRPVPVFQLLLPSRVNSKAPTIN
jgi:hypothetical protein